MAGAASGSQEQAQNAVGRSPFVSSFPAQAVKMLASQLPAFGGTEKEDVEIWIKKIEKVAQIHRVSDEVTLLAASDKLVKTARRWLDLGTGTVNQSWLVFREAIVRRFKRKVLFHVVMQKVEARTWNYGKETFHDYAMDKLILLDKLQLSEENGIHLLIDGIDSAALRASAVVLDSSTIDDFLEKMQNVTATFTMRKSVPIDNKFPRERKRPEAGLASQKATPNGKIDTQRNSQSWEPSCFHCHAKGHIRRNCPSLRRGRAATTPESAVAVSAVCEEAPEEAEDASTVATVEVQPTEGIRLTDAEVTVVTVNNQNCKLSALLDTGSPVSFMRNSVFKRFFEIMSPSDNIVKNLRAVNGTLIEVGGSVGTRLSLLKLPDKVFTAKLHVLNGDKLSYDFILGSDFMRANRLKIEIDYSRDSTEERMKLFSQIASVECAETALYEHDARISDMVVDFDDATKEKLLSIIEEVEKSDCESIKDEFVVSVNLKDESTFAYAPRRFAFYERNELRRITDDLLSRSIRVSTSPYCARVVLVKKRSGLLRLCVDLRQLNDRVVKQRFPFPIIEDTLSRLEGKSVFTLIDLKDGFHQLKITPAHTKYFSFGTPDGQFEYLKLPFGYCKAPKEFQKRLNQILQPLIRADQICVYMDDILIHSDSVSVEENLEVTRKVLMLLKQYEMQINYKKSCFLRKEIEYLGYVITSAGFTLSPRHIESVRDFPQPRGVVELQRFLGLTNCFRKFIENYAVKARPLQNLLHKNVAFVFDGKCVEAFELLKRELIAEPVLHLYNRTAETELHTDASSVAYAAILLQKQKTGHLKPVAYYSQITNQAEKNYHSFELEMLAVVKAVERLHIYLYGITFTVVTDWCMR